MDINFRLRAKKYMASLIKDGNGKIQMNIDQIAAEIHRAIMNREQITPFTDRDIPLSSTDAYKISAKLCELRTWQVNGRKIGFTNRSIWPIYGVDQPMWGSMSKNSISYAKNGSSSIKLSDYCEPRIEPEIVVCFASTPPLRATEEQIANSIAWVAPGFEIVDSIYPGWKFNIPDTIAAGGLHGQLVVGEKVKNTNDLRAKLIDQKVTLCCDNKVVEEGSGGNVLDGPISALKHLLDGISAEPSEISVKAGDIVTTGTLTDAKPLRVGQTWNGKYSGIISSSLSVEIV